MFKREIKLLSLESLREHEKVIACHLARLMEQIKNDGFISHPIIVDRNSMVILDGHHRFNTLKMLGLRLCPACLVDYYGNDEVAVGCWREGEKITKEQVIAAGLSGKLLEPKTSKHTIPDPPEGLKIPLSDLR